MALPREYLITLRGIRERIREARLRAVLIANTMLVRLYWDVGRIILDRQARAGWGSRIIDRLSADLRESFPDMTGFSPRNLKYMRAFAAAWSRRAIVQEPLAQLPWSHHIALLEKLDAPRERLWYASRSTAHGWSHHILILQIEGRVHERQGRAITNFPATLPPAGSDLAEQVFKDPYLFDFLGTADLRRERDVERALVDKVQRFLMELGTGFAFVGRQVPLRVGNRDYLVDLLLYHLKLRCYVIVELKIVPFDPAFVGQLNLYLSAADDLLRHPDDQPSIGLMLCRTRERIVVEYALRHLERPIGVARWQTKLVDELPATFRGSLPTVAQIEAELTRGAKVRAKRRPRRRGS
jgi:predicted nuclease of restriction endonuclease-like (RecB) superfamily